MFGVMAVTIREVAAAAQVSVATVSRALRGLSSVSPATRERVEAAAAALDYTLPYRPDLSTPPKTLRVGVVLPYIGRWYFAQVLSGIESVIGDKDGDVVVIRPFDRTGRRKDLADCIDPKNIDAVILVTISITEPEINWLKERNISVSLLGTFHPKINNVRIDDYDAMKTVTDYLISKGHTRIGMIGSAAFDPAPNQVHIERTNGFRGAMIAANLTVDEQLIVQTDFSIKGAQRAVEKLFELENPPTAIVAESDELAFGVITAARLHGIRVPEDLSVTGIDDHDASDSFELTTVAQPVDSLGEVAAWQVISHSEVPASVCMPTSLIIRNSTAELKK